MSNVQDLGIVSPVPKGDWKSTTAYQQLNIVRFNSASYIATAPSIGVAPGVTNGWQSFWQLLSSGVDEDAQKQIDQNAEAISALGGSVEELKTATKNNDSSIVQINKWIEEAEKDPVEYGIRHVIGASSPVGERVIRKDGVISTWDIDFTPNIGTEPTDNPFDYISVFNPSVWYDEAGNKFARFSRFYYLKQIIGNYEYTWVCRKQLYPFYVLPKAFKRDGKPYWNYVDIGCYEASAETRTFNGADYACLASKPGKNPRHNATRTVMFNEAKNLGTTLEINTEQEYYCITTMSEVNEIRNILVHIMFGTRNCQSKYNGISSFGNTGATAFAAVDKENNIFYFATNVLKDFRVGATVALNGSATETYYRQVIENGEVVGGIADGAFVESVGGATYYYAKIDGDALTELTIDLTSISIRPLFTGETDIIKATHGTLNNTNGRNSFKVFNIENMWGNIWEHVLDCTIKEYVPYVCDDITKWTDTTTPDTNENFKACDMTIAQTSSSYVKALDYDPAHPDIVLPVEVGASASTYWCDYYWVSAGVRTVYVGGRLFYGANVGFCCWICCSGVGYAYWDIGGRLSHRSL